MKPLNRAERTNAFVRFLLLFMVTVALVVTVVFSSVDVTRKESDLLRRQVKSLQDQREFSESFAKDLRETQLALEKYADPVETSAATQERVNNQLNKLRGKVRQSVNNENTLFELMIVSLSELNDTKKKLRDTRIN